ncbi:MAG: PD-(D/E)XK nuclease family protein [Candidatus Nanoarchaeia archaeon]|nr:PD-(D/E)XK nuclease family protein [Candidatus Nanoarchaeia archaeon]
MTLYSYSRISTFEQCPLKFKFRYIEKITPEIEHTVEAYLGGKVHEALEWMYSQVIKKQAPQLEDVIEYYAKSWKKDFKENIRIVNPQLTFEYYFDKGIKFIIDYFVKNYPFSDNTIELEHQVIIDLNNNGKYVLQGYIDRLVHDKESNIFEIHDYKTGSIRSQDDLDKDKQLALYSIGVKDKFNAEEVHLIWHFLDFNQKMISKRTPEQLEQLKQEIIRLINKIESTTDFPAIPSSLCRWCEFGKYCEFKKG